MPRSGASSHRASALQVVTNRSSVCSKPWTCVVLSSWTVADGLDCAVEHQGPDPIRMEGRVGRADLGAVAVTEERELLVTERRPDVVEVSSDVGRAHVLDQVRVLLLAAVSEGALLLLGSR